jgi:two-component system, OmpR family, phosphate regulon response regulator PhoB
MGKPRILLIEDERGLTDVLTYNLNREGYETLVSHDGVEGLRKAQMHLPDLILLDLMLPGMDGLEVCRQLRAGKLTAGIPILMLTAKSEETDQIVGFTMGADDYVTKPFSMPELEARIRTALRHSAASTDDAAPTALGAGPIDLDLVHHEARMNGELVSLTAKEFDVLAFLVRYAGRICTQEMILSAVWGPGYKREAQYLHAYIHRLRHKLGDADGHLIRTVPGVGYTLA